MTTPTPDPGPATAPLLPALGWREHVDFPDWHIRGVRAKVDTGARTSAIDVAEIEELPDGRLRFEVVARLRPDRRTKWVVAEPARTTIVKPSSGKRQLRHVCLARIRIGDHEQEIELSLVCRKGMLCRMLLGRTAIAEHFVVDPSRTYVQSSATRRRHHARRPELDP